MFVSFILFAYYMYQFDKEMEEADKHGLLEFKDKTARFNPEEHPLDYGTERRKQ